MDQHYYRNQQSMCEKISSSVKKSHKISIYSKKSTKSPKKNDLPLQQLTVNTQQIKDLPIGFANQHAVQMNSAKNHYHQNPKDANNNSQPLSQYKPIDKLSLTKQLSYHQRTNPSDFFNQPIAAMIKKPHTFINPNNISEMIDKQAQSQINSLSILQGSLLAGNQRGTTATYKQSKDLIVDNGKNNTSQQRQMMSTFMNFLHEQIAVTKQNYEQKFNLALKSNIHTIKDLQSRLYQNHVLIKEKTEEIQMLKEVIRRNGVNSKRIHNQGESGSKEVRSGSVGMRQQNKAVNSNNSNNDGYYSKRINDLQTKLSILQQVFSKPQQTLQFIQSKLQLLQKSLIQHMSSKLHSLSSTLQIFLSASSTKLSTLYQSIDTISSTLTNFQSESKKIGFNQNRIKQLSNKLGELDEEVKNFLVKELKYENYGVYELKEWVGKMKERMREFEGFQFQNSKLLKELGEQLIKAKSVATTKQQNFLNQPQNIVISLSQAHDTMSKYSHSNNNLSKNSISQLSNTHQYSHLIQKLTPIQNSNSTINQQNNIIMSRNMRNINCNNNVTTSESLISMNFTEQEIQQSVMIQESRKQKDVRCEGKGESEIKVSKYTRATTQMMKETNISNLNTYGNFLPANTNFSKNNMNNSPSIITATVAVSKLSMPNTHNNALSIHSILSPLVLLSSTQQKIRNLSQLKMESKQRLSVISSSLDHDHEQSSLSQEPETSRSPLDKNKIDQKLSIPQQPSLQNNTSYLSIGQLQDYHQSFEYRHLLQLQSNNNINNNTSCDWSDDEFFYPQYQDSDKKQSNVQLYNWERSPQKLSSREDLGSLSAKSPQSMKYSNHYYQTTNDSPPNNNYEKLTKSKSGEQHHFHQKQQSNSRKKLIYSGTFDYERFSDSEDQDNKGVTSGDDNFRSPIVLKKSSNGIGVPLHLTKFPPQNHTVKNQQKPPLSPEKFTINEQKLVQQCKLLQKSQLPLKLIYDRKKCQGIAKMQNPSHQLHGKTFILEKKSLQKLQHLGFIQVKTYI